MLETPAYAKAVEFLHDVIGRTAGVLASVHVVDVNSINDESTATSYITTKLGINERAFASNACLIQRSIAFSHSPCMVVLRSDQSGIRLLYMA